MYMLSAKDTPSVVWWQVASFRGHQPLHSPPRDAALHLGASPAARGNSRSFLFGSSSYNIFYSEAQKPGRRILPFVRITHSGTEGTTAAWPCRSAVSPVIQTWARTPSV